MLVQSVTKSEGSSQQKRPRSAQLARQALRGRAEGNKHQLVSFPSTARCALRDCRVSNTSRADVALAPRLKVHESPATTLKPAVLFSLYQVYQAMIVWFFLPWKLPELVQEDFWRTLRGARPLLGSSDSGENRHGKIAEGFITRRSRR